MIDRNEAIRSYTRAWGLREESEIRKALESCWTASSSYISPLTDEVRGIEGLVGLILDFPVMFPSAVLRATSRPDTHHHAAFFTWELSSSMRIRTLGRDFGRTLAGVDFVEFGPDSKIWRITAFFGVDPKAAGAAFMRTDELEPAP